MGKRLILYVLIFTISFSSCGIFRDKNLAKRYNNHWNSNTFGLSSDPQAFVQVDLHTTLLNETPAKEINYNVLSLSDKGQEAFITAASQMSTTPAQLMALLNSNFEFSKEDKPSIKIIPKTIKKTLIFTIDRLQYQYVPATPAAPGIPATKAKTIFNNLGDRIAYLELNVHLTTASHAVFNSWDRFVSDRLTLNLGKVSSAQNWNASLSLAAKGSGETSFTGSNTTEGTSSNTSNGTVTLVNTGESGSSTTGNGFQLVSSDKGTDNKTNGTKASAELGGNATVGFTDKYETSLDLTSQILKLSGTLAPDKILLRQEGGPGIDLSGNVVVSIEYALTDDWASPVQFTKYKELYNAGTHTPLAAAGLTPKFLTVIFPDIINDISGELNYSFLYRQVNHGNRHLPEARQKVTYRHGNVPFNQNIVTNKVPAPLIIANDVRPKVFQIAQGVNKLRVNSIELKFETVTEAAAFLHYINELNQAGGSLAAITNSAGAVLTSGAIPNLKIVTVQL
ncbi:hypothetical protein [Ferruginibacter sp.]